MTKKEFYQLPIGAIIYNEKSEEVVEFTSGYTADKEEEEEDYRSVRNIFAEGHDEWSLPRSRYGIEVKDHESWEIYKSIDQIKNPNLQIEIMKREIAILKNLIYKHLRIDHKFTHLI